VFATYRAETTEETAPVERTVPVESHSTHAPLAYLSRGQTDTGQEAAAADLSALTRRELEVALLIAQGLSNQEIATRLFLSVRTVESHVLQARTKLGAGRRRDLGRLVAQSSQRQA
jgi:DNA-binding CsgD family transcriptional regulator